MGAGGVLCLVLIDTVIRVSAIADVVARGADPGVRVQTMLLAAISTLPSVIVQAGALVVVDNSGACHRR